MQDFADSLIAAGLAPATVSNVLSPIQVFYRREVQRGRLATNPASGVDVPEAIKSPRRIASAQEAAALLGALPAEDRPLWATAFYAGLRRGELQALRVSDVDLGASLIRVEHGWDQREGEIDPKSRAARRTVPVLALLRDYLDEHLLRTGREGSQLMFGRTAADPFAPQTVDKRAKLAWRDAGLKPLTLHECRHTFASLLIDSGANPKAIQEFMGHARIQTTFDTYGHLIDGSRDEVRRRMDAYLDERRLAVSASEETEDDLTGPPTGPPASKAD